VGALSSPAVEKWMRKARVLAIPSVTAETGDTEGLPITLLEAFAVGLPVVGTRHAGIPEAITHDATGLLVGERDARGLAEALSTLLTDAGAWRRMSDGARDVVATKFDLERQTAALEEIYDGIRGVAGATRLAGSRGKNT
jgi:colanic acid/amylovoran biosynthesis glycosyltransferase